MATIYAISSSFGTASWNDPNIWQGGIVPGANDLVFIEGKRFQLWQFDLSGTAFGGFKSSPSIQTYSGIGYWEGYRDIFVRQEFFTGSGDYPSGTDLGLPQSGSIYAYTDRDVLVKIDYKGFYYQTRGTGSWFTSCSVDTSFFKWSSGSEDLIYGEALPSKYGGFIPYQSAMMWQPGVIAISGSDVVDIYQVIIRNGGKLHVHDSASVKLGNYIDLRDGEFKMYDKATLTYENGYSGSLNATYTSDLQLCLISQSNYNFSTLELIGAEVRSNTTLTNNISVGDSYITVQNTSSFEIQDWIFVGEETPTVIRQDDGTKYPYSRKVSSEDESFYVVGKDTNKLYIKRVNAIESQILSSSSATEWIVDEERWQVGDKVVVNNQTATITAVEDYELLLNDYDFTNPTASLADWETNTSRSFWFAGWSLVPGVGVVNNSQESFNQYRHIIEKNVIRDRVKIEAWISNVPLTVTGSNTGSYSLYSVDNNINSYFGVFINSDLSLDHYQTLPINSYGGSNWTRNYFGVYPEKGYYFLQSRTQFNTGFSQSLDLTNCGVTTPYRGLYKFGFEYTKGFLKGYINDVLITEEIVRGGNMWGRSGIFTSNNRIILTKFKSYAKCQKITLNTAITANIGDTIYETGAEYSHPSGSEVIKLASIITDPLDYKNLAHNYIGTSEYDNTGVYPYVMQLNFTGSDNLGLIRNNGSYTFHMLTNNLQNGFLLQSGSDYQQGTVTINLESMVSMSNIGFVEWWYQTGQRFTSSLFSISGSVDGLNWIPLTGGADFRGRYNDEAIRSYDFTPGVYKYVRLKMGGLSGFGTTFANSNWNHIKSIYVRNFSSGSSTPRFQVNNASDFNVGDHITILPNNSNRSYNWTGTAFNNTTFYNALQQGSGSFEMLDSYPDHHTVTHISGNLITLDRPFNKYPIQKGAYVIKLSREVNLSGSYSPNNYKTGRLVSNMSNFRYQNYCIIKNVGIQQQNNHLPYQNNQGGQGIPLGFYRDGAFDVFIFQGNSLYNNNAYGNFWFYNYQNQAYINGALFRKNVFYEIRDGWASNFGYGSGYASYPKILTGNIFHNNTFGFGGAGNAGPTYTNISHNLQVIGFWGVAGGGFSPTTNQYRFGYSQKYISERNLLIGCNSLFPTINSWTGTNVERNTYVVIKNNKVSNSYSGFGGPFRYAPDFYLDTPLSDARGGFDYALYSTNLLSYNNYNSNHNGFNGGISSLIEAIPSAPVKNYNRQGYDVWSFPKGWIIKQPNDDWYKFYNFSAQSSGEMGNMRVPILSAGVSLNTDKTASFNLSFDYYLSSDLIANLDQPFSMSFNSNLLDSDSYNHSFRGTNSCALYLQVFKDGKSILPNGDQYEIIPKTSNPTKYSKSFTLEGEGYYYIMLGQIGMGKGFTAFKNIDSVLIKPEDESIFVTHNGFTMKNFALGEEKTVRKATTRVEIANQKFRLKGAKLF